VLALREAQFRAAGLSVQKARYLRDLASRFLNGTIKTRSFAKLSDETIKQKLLIVKGIGPWSADMFLIFALNRPDVLPTEDLGIKKGFQKVFSLRRLPSARTMIHLAAPYRGRRTLLSLYLWQTVDNSASAADAPRPRPGEPW